MCHFFNCAVIRPNFDYNFHQLKVAAHTHFVIKPKSIFQGFPLLVTSTKPMWLQTVIGTPRVYFIVIRHSTNRSDLKGNTKEIERKVTPMKEILVSHHVRTINNLDS